MGAVPGWSPGAPRLHELSSARLCPFEVTAPAQSPPRGEFATIELFSDTIPEWLKTAPPPAVLEELALRVLWETFRSPSLWMPPPSSAVLALTVLFETDASGPAVQMPPPASVA